MSASPRAAYVLLLAMAICWGGTWPAGKLAVEDVSPFTVAAARFAIATVLLAAWAATRRTSYGRPRLADLPLMLALGLTAVAGYNALFLYGLELAPATDGAIIVPGLAPVFTALLAWPVLSERLSGRAVAGLMLALAGLVLVVEPAGGVDRDRLLGAALFVGGAVCWAVYSVLGRPATARFGVIKATMYGTATGTLLLIPLSAAEGGWSELAGADLESWLSIGYLAVFGTVLGFVLFYEGVRRIGASRATAFAMLVPIFGVLSSVLVLGEDLGGATLAGGAAILAGLWLVQRPGSVKASRFSARALQTD
jgi:drug/metabolite transporter (DMT)-like permease